MQKCMMTESEVTKRGATSAVDSSVQMKVSVYFYACVFFQVRVCESHVGIQRFQGFLAEL